MARHRYKMYRPAQEWQDVGIIGERLQFTDDDIITTQGIGYTKALMESGCYPMDAAVMFSLLSAGPDARLNTRDLINTYTRTATRFEQRRVALRPCIDENAPSCGHDEKELKYRWMFPRITKNYQYGGYFNNVIDPSDKKYLMDTMEFKYWYKPQSNNYRMTFNDIYMLFDAGKTSADTVQAFCDNYPELFIEYDNKEDMPWDKYRSFYIELGKMKGLKEGVKDRWLPKKALKLCIKHKHIREVSALTNGDCAWTNMKKEIDGKIVQCAHHAKLTFPKWVYSEQPCYTNDRINAWGSFPKFQVGGAINLSKSETLLSWDEHSRSIVRDVTDKEVRKLVSKSLSRLATKGGRVMKFGHGRERTFTWRHWEWLDKIQHKIMNTNAKKRKIGDEVNGWIYSKHNIQQSYGMEICDYVWKPIEKLAIYNILNTSVKKRHWGTGVEETQSYLHGIFFASKEEAEGYCNVLNGLNPKYNIHYKVVQTNTKTGEKVTKNKWIVKANELAFALKGVIHPEDYMHPKQILDMWLKAAPEVWANKEGDFETIPNQMVTRISFTPKQEVSA